jgi:hypothetical protein
VLEPGDHTHDVGQRVEGADLVEVDVLGADAVHPALGDGQPLEDDERAVPHGRRERGTGEQRADVVPGAVLVAGRRVHVHPGGPEPVPGDLLDRQPHRLDRQRRHRRGQHVQRHAGVDQGTEQHVAAGPRREIQPADHGVIMPGGDIAILADDTAARCRSRPR